MKIRICTKCGVEKELTKDNFSKNKRYLEGFTTWCKECYKAAGKTWKDKEVKTNPDFHKNNALRKHHLKGDEYAAKLESQDGHCALCESTNTSGQRLSVDHDHSHCSGKYSCKKCHRGLLCGSCNARIGYLELLLKQGTVIPLANTWLFRALSYLEKWKEIHELIDTPETWEAKPGSKSFSYLLKPKDTQ